MYARICRGCDAWFLSLKDEEKLSSPNCTRCGQKMFLVNNQSEKEMAKMAFREKNRIIDPRDTQTIK